MSQFFFSLCVSVSQSSRTCLKFVCFHRRPVEVFMIVTVLFCAPLKGSIVPYLMAWLSVKPPRKSQSILKMTPNQVVVMIKSVTIIIILVLGTSRAESHGVLVVAKARCVYSSLTFASTLALTLGCESKALTVYIKLLLLSWFSLGSKWIISVANTALLRFAPLSV